MSDFNVAPVHTAFDPPVFDPVEHPHRRLNALTGDWVLVSPHRAKRPWQGQVEAADNSVQPSYDETCYLCPGNVRINGAHNPAYQGPFVFQNDFAALNTQTPDASFNQEDLLQLQSEQGCSRVNLLFPGSQQDAAGAVDQRNPGSDPVLDPPVSGFVTRLWLGTGV